MRFTRLRNGRVSVDSFDEDAPFSFEFFRTADPQYVARLGFRSFSLRCSNGTACYRIVARGPHPKTFQCHRVA